MQSPRRPVINRPRRLHRPGPPRRRPARHPRPVHPPTPLPPGPLPPARLPRLRPVRHPRPVRVPVRLPQPLPVRRRPVLPPRPRAVRPRPARLPRSHRPRRPRRRPARPRPVRPRPARPHPVRPRPVQLSPARLPRRRPARLPADRVRPATVPLGPPSPPARPTAPHRPTAPVGHRSTVVRGHRRMSDHPVNRGARISNVPAPPGLVPEAPVLVRGVRGHRDRRGIVAASSRRPTSAGVRGSCRPAFAAAGIVPYPVRRSRTVRSAKKRAPRPR